MLKRMHGCPLLLTSNTEHVFKDAVLGYTIQLAWSSVAPGKARELPYGKASLLHYKSLNLGMMVQRASRLFRANRICVVYGTIYSNPNTKNT